jgi:hypothetical protein
MTRTEFWKQALKDGKVNIAELFGNTKRANDLVWWLKQNDMYIQFVGYIVCSNRHLFLDVMKEYESIEFEDEVYNAVDPAHYQRGMECIDEMLMIFGKEAVYDFCILNAWKYRYRALDKNGKEDMEKSDWYIAKAKELDNGTETYC